MKNKNILLILENHVDKIVLGIIALISISLMWVYIIGNPYGVEVKGRKRNPSQIDSYIKKEADQLYAKLDKAADPMPNKKSFLPEYEKLLQCPFSDISVAATLMPNPGVGDLQGQEDRMYALPKIPPLTDVQIGSMRGAAQVPIEQVGPDQSYEMVPKEVEDVDLVTISSRFDVQALFNEFQQKFAGPRLKTAWKDQRLAKPVFARLELQRRVKKKDESWGQWERVSRTRIDSYRDLLHDLPMTMGESQFGVDAWLSQYDRQDVQYDILQPEAYLFTISRTEWMSPEFLDEVLEIMEKEEKEAAREKQEQRGERSTRTGDRRRTPTRQPSRRDSRRDRRGADDFMGMGIGGQENTRPRREDTRKERDADDVREDFEKELLDEKSDIGSMRDSLLIWAHDDSAEPGKTYQYRIRIGVLNPIAGKDWFQDDQADFKNQLVLWSDYSEPTEAVSILKRVYVFPMGVNADKDAPEDIESVQVEVAKYYMGRWRDFDFDVVPGQLVGYEVEDVQEEDETENAMGDFQPMAGGMGTGQDPEMIDFTSDITLVDVIREVAWGSRLRASSLYKMLYYDSDKKIQQAAIGKSNWDSDVRRVYSEIQESMKQDVEQRRGPSMMPGGPMPGMMPGMMLQ
ncbi:MAG: hypothetical protein ACYSTO_04355 [Planctomycetota bacterium]|jgi:hypothetical protein